MRRQTYRKNKSKKSMIMALISIAFVALFIFIIAYDSPTGNRADKVIDNDIVIQSNEIDDTAKFYPAIIDGLEIEVIAVRALDGTIRTAFNTCQSCYTSGRGFFVQQDNVLICNNCGNQFIFDQIEKTNGACNPVPITESVKTVTEDTITIPQEYLSQAVVMFKSWK